MHAAVNSQGMYVWGEDADAGSKVLSHAGPRTRRRSGSGSPPRTGSPRKRPHPYAADGMQLFNALVSGGLLPAAPPPEPGSPVADEIVIHLPSAGRLPLPSSPLIGAITSAETDETPITLLPFKVPSALCEGAAAIGFLLHAGGRRVLGDGVMVGDDFLFWTRALSFRLSLVARQRLLPGVSVESGRLFARWRPILGAGDRAAFDYLAAAMPGAARAVPLQPVSRGAPAALPSAHETLESFLNLVVDRLARMAFAHVMHGWAPSQAGQRRGRARSAATIHEKWLLALRSEDGEVGGPAPELASLHATITDWQRPLAYAEAAPYRLCLRLEEPAEDRAQQPASNGAPWRLRYLVQDVADPSLLLPADEIWRGRGRRPERLRRADLDLREYLLTALGQAASVYPEIERSLEGPAPAGLELDAAGAYEFLAGYAPALEQAGFGVMLPAWWTGKGTRARVGVRARVKADGFESSAGLSADTICGFDWELALGGEKITAAELRELARMKAPLVKVRGQWVQLDAGEIRAALDFWRRRGQFSSATLQETVRMALGGLAAPGGLPLDGIEAEGPVGDMLAQLNSKESFAQVPPPAGFRGKLRPYQLRGYSWLCFLSRFALGACLADDMGLGKTIQALAFVQRLRESGVRRPALLVCPTSVLGNWQKEASRFTPDLPVLVHSGPGRARDAAAFAAAAEGQAIVITSYALLQRDFPLFAGTDWAGLMLDEAQNIKNPETKQARAARSLRGGFRIALTGTPVENNVGDLWSIMECLNPGLLGTRADFRRRFFLPIQVGGDARAAEGLRRLTGPFILRRLKTDPNVISDLPEKTEARVFCNLTREQASLYAAVVAELEEGLEEAEGMERRGRVLAALSKLKQVCNHPAQFLGDNSPLPGRSGKLARLTEMLEQSLASGDRALVFSQFAAMGALLQRHLRDTFGCEVLFLHGGVPRGERDRMIERFQDAGGPPLFVLSLKAGGTGLNLTRANQVFHFDRWWNPAVENQATDRAFRIGQTRKVFVHKFVCLGTFEEGIDELIERKRELSERIVGSGEGWLTELSTAELRELVALRGEAVRE